MKTFTDAKKGQYREAFNARVDREAFNAKGRDYFLKRYASLKGRAQALLNAARRSTKVNKLGEMTLTLEWLLPKLEAGVCERTGIRFHVVAGKGKTGNQANVFSPSLDRVDPKGPYTPENVKVVVWVYNRAKGPFRLEDFEEMCRRVAERAETERLHLKQGAA